MRSAVLTVVVAVVAGVAVASGGAHASAQVTIFEPATLDVSSIKVSNENRGGSLGMLPGGRFVATNVRVRDFMNMAFQRRPALLTEQIIGLPAWASTVRYNISATFVGDPSAFDPKDGVGPYVRALLDARFAFRAHVERREMPVYTLTVARTGLKLAPSTLNCDSPHDECVPQYGPGRMSGVSISVNTLANEIAAATDRPLVDHTGLSGWFQVDLQWNPNPLDSSDPRPTNFGAVQDLGLRLDPGRALVDALIVDHIEPPTPD